MTCGSHIAAKHKALQCVTLRFAYPGWTTTTAPPTDSGKENDEPWLRKEITEQKPAAGIMRKLVQDDPISLASPLGACAEGRLSPGTTCAPCAEPTATTGSTSRRRRNET